MTAYATLAEARTHGGITDSSRDADLSRLLLAASRAIDRAIGIPDGAFIASSPSSVSVFLDRPRRSLVLENFLYQVIGVFYSPDGSAANEVDETDQIVPAAARLGAQPPFRVLVRRDGYAFPAGWWRIHGRWGVSESPPPDIAQAVIILALYWLRHGPTHYAVEALSAMEGRVVAADQIPPSVMETITAWRARLGTIP